MQNLVQSMEINIVSGDINSVWPLIVEGRGKWIKYKNVDYEFKYIHSTLLYLAVRAITTAWQVRVLQVFFFPFFSTWLLYIFILVGEIQIKHKNYIEK